MKLEDDIIRKSAEIKESENTIKVDKGNILLDDIDIKRIREEVIKKNEEEEKIKTEKKANRRAIVSLVLGIASWIGMITIIIPLVGGIWAIVDGCKALMGKTKYKKSAIFGIVLPILFYVLLIIVMVQGVVSESKRDAQLNYYIENGQYAEAQEFIAQEYTIGSLSYVEQCANLFELQGRYDEAVDLWAEYCSNEYEPIDIPDSRINKLNEYLDKYETDLKPETIEKVHNLLNNREMAKTKEQKAKEAEEQKAKETEEESAKTKKKNVSEDNTQNNNDIVGNVSNQTNVSKIPDSVKTWYNNGNPHTYKYEDKNYYIIAEMYMNYYDESGFRIQELLYYCRNVYELL